MFIVNWMMWIEIS